MSHGAAGTLVIDRANPAGSRIEIAAPIERFDSGNSTRDANMLDAVDTETYPEVRFVSMQVAPGTQAGTWQVTGTLSLHGQTHPLELPVQITSGSGLFEGTGPSTYL